MSGRTATVERKTSETQITCTLGLDSGPGFAPQEISVSTGIGFLDHVSGKGARRGVQGRGDIWGCWGMGNWLWEETPGDGGWPMLVGAPVAGRERGWVGRRRGMGRVRARGETR